MPKGLERHYGRQHLHFITFSCYRRRPFLRTGRRRDMVLRALERSRQTYRFHVVGYVVMPEHVHPLITETAFHFWQARFYDFNVWSAKKWLEKLRYMHRNPVKRGLVPRPEDWRWSSYRYYAFAEVGLVKVSKEVPVRMPVRAPTYRMVRCFHDACGVGLGHPPRMR
jgi:putative transposase